MEDSKTARATLRRNFLMSLIANKGKRVELDVRERNDKMNGVFEGCDCDFSHVLISKLETGIGQQPHAMVRVNDIISIKFLY